MRNLIAPAFAVATLLLAGSAAIDSAMAAPQAKQLSAGASDATDFSARRLERRHRHYSYRSYYQPHYYARPVYYRPYPYSLPVPFFLGIGFGW